MINGVRRINIIKCQVKTNSYPGRLQARRLEHKDSPGRSSPSKASIEPAPSCIGPFRTSALFAASRGKRFGYQPRYKRYRGCAGTASAGVSRFGRMKTSRQHSSGLPSARPSGLAVFCHKTYSLVPCVCTPALDGRDPDYTTALYLARYPHQHHKKNVFLIGNCGPRYVFTQDRAS